MSRHISSAASLSAVGALALALVLAGGAAGAPNRSADFGQHVAACAQEHLGHRDGAPGVSCSHDGMTMTFPTFGAMVQHMKTMHAE